MVGGSSFMEEVDCGSFFDHIDDLLEFPSDDIDNVLIGKGAGSGPVGYGEFPPIWLENSPDSVLPGSGSNGASDLSAELSVPYEDVVQLEWSSTFVEDSFSGGGLTVDASHPSPFTKDSSQNQFQTSRPVSVLESSSSACSNGNITIPVTHEKRARSKRPRPATFTPRASIKIISPTSSFTDTPHPQALLEREGFAESRSLKRGPKRIQAEQQTKKKKIKILPPSNSNSNSNSNVNTNPPPSSQSQAVRKCMHCEITKTPQWRAGPLGPKTLCNACGVRYKSGRLFPEYRPAASPTFVPLLHSNSHKKVIEMRTKTTKEPSTVAAATSCVPKLILRNDILPESM